MMCEVDPVWNSQNGSFTPFCIAIPGTRNPKSYGLTKQRSYNTNNIETPTSNFRLHFVLL